MAEPKPLASLTSGLLARKGGARPAMRRQQVLGSGPVSHEASGHDDLGWNDMGYDVNPVQTNGGAVERHDSGLSPMTAHDSLPEPQLHRLHGDGADPVSLDSAPEPEVLHQQRRVEALAQTVAITAPAPLPDVEPTVAPAIPVAVAVPAKPRARARTAAGAKGSFAFTLRLDSMRHLYLRLASATSNQSAQNILTTLLDGYFAGQPMIAALAAQVPPDGSAPLSVRATGQNDSMTGERT